MAVATRETLCPNCGKTTESIRGRCPNCAFLKDPQNAGPVTARRAMGGSLSDDFGNLLTIGLWLAPVVTLGILGLVLSLDVLVVVAAVVFLVPLALRALTDWH